MAISYEWRGERGRDPAGRGGAGQARAAGCEWLHVDFEDHLRGFSFDACVLDRPMPA